MRCLTNVNRTPVIAEIVALAAKHTGLKVEYQDEPEAFHTMDSADATEAFGVGYDPTKLKETMGSIWGPPLTDLSAFWNEYDRLSDLITKPLNEPILPDDHPVVQGHLYVVNGKVREFIDGERVNVGMWKRMRISGVAPVTEVRRCDQVGRTLRAPLEKAPQTTFQSGWDRAGRSMNQRHRRPRCSNKIRKVK